MFDVTLTQDNGTCTSGKFATYEAMVRWIAHEPDAGIMAWDDSAPFDTEAFIQLQNDVEALR
jgi:hypothetical protein